MSQWEMDDSAANSVNWAVAQFKKTPNTANRDAFYGNTTVDAFVTGATVGIFAVDATEIGVTNGSIVSYTITNNGSGYRANAAVTVSGNATSNATANSIGRVSAVNNNTAGSSYTTKPTVSIAAPAAQTFNSNTALYLDATFNSATGVANTTEFITTASAHGFTNGDIVQYRTATGNTALTGLTNAASYVVRYANTTAFILSANATSANLDLTAAATGETGHTLRRVGQGFITIATNVLQDGDKVTYTVNSGNTALTGLTSGALYYVVGANTTGVKLSATSGGDSIVLTPGVSEAGHSLTGETATAEAVLTYAGRGVAHTGWNIRTVGTGGRAGRIQYETLVAGGITTDGEDTIFKDS
jgi:hypothetical protein